MIHFSDNIKRIRIAKSLSQSDFAAILNLNKTTYANYETGYSTPKHTILGHISDTLGIPAESLMYTQLQNEIIEKCISNSIPLSIPNIQKPTQMNKNIQVQEPDILYQSKQSKSIQIDDLIKQKDATIEALQGEITALKSIIKLYERITNTIPPATP